MKKEEKRQVEEAIEFLEDPEKVVEFLLDGSEFNTENKYIQKLIDTLRTHYNDNQYRAITYAKWFKNNLKYTLNYDPYAVTPDPY